MKVRKTVIVDRIHIILVVLAALWIGFLAFTVHVQASGTGEITATFPGEAAGAELTLYEVADVQDGNLVFREPFQDTDLTLSDLSQASKVETATAQLTAIAEKNGVSGTMVTVEQSGTICFTDLEPALYLLAQTNGLDNIQIQNMLVIIPYTDADGSLVYDVNLQPKYALPGEGSLNVTKHIMDSQQNLVIAVDATFYVALFADEDRTQRVTDVKKMQFDGSYADTVTFENLRLDTLYYVGETDENGVLLESGVLRNVPFAPVYPNGDLVNLTAKQPEVEFVFYNTFSELPDGLHYEGELTITKKVLKGTKAFATDKVFYAAIFTDKEHTQRYGDLVVLDMAGKSGISVTIPVHAGNAKGDSISYYVTETDSKGNPLGGNLGFTSKIDQDKVVLKPDDRVKRVTITNIYSDKPEMPGENVTLPTPPNSPYSNEIKTTQRIIGSSTQSTRGVITTNPSHSTSNEIRTTEKTAENSTGNLKTTKVKTGDDTPIEKYLLLAVITLVLIIIIGTFLYRKLRKKGQKR